MTQLLHVYNKYLQAAFKLKRAPFCRSKNHSHHIVSCRTYQKSM